MIQKADLQFDHLKEKLDTRFISVGRLDMDSEGLLLLLMTVI